MLEEKHEYYSTLVKEGKQNCSMCVVSKLNICLIPNEIMMNITAGGSYTGTHGMETIDKARVTADLRCSAHTHLSDHVLQQMSPGNSDLHYHVLHSDLITMFSSTTIITKD